MYYILNPLYILMLYIVLEELQHHFNNIINKQILIDFIPVYSLLGPLVMYTMCPSWSVYFSVFMQLYNS